MYIRVDWLLRLPPGTGDKARVRTTIGGEYLDLRGEIQISSYRAEHFYRWRLLARLGTVLLPIVIRRWYWAGDATERAYAREP